MKTYTIDRVCKWIRAEMSDWAITLRSDELDDYKQIADTIKLGYNPNRKTRIAKWIEDSDGDGCTCSACGSNFCYMLTDESSMKSDWNYCPSCGSEIEFDKDDWETKACIAAGR